MRRGVTGNLLLICAIALGMVSPALAVTPKASSKARWPKEPRVKKPITLYRGLYISPSEYKPKAWARKFVWRPGTGKVKRKSREIWASERLDAALNYAAGNLTKSLAPRRKAPKQAVVLEFALPQRLFKWEAEGADRGWFSRLKIPDDRAFLRRIGVVDLPKNGHAEVAEWLTPKAFFERHKR